MHANKLSTRVVQIVAFVLWISNSHGAGADQRLFGAKTAYAWVADIGGTGGDMDQVTEIQGRMCKAVHVNMVARHGYRYHGYAEIRGIRKMLDKIRSRTNDIAIPFFVTGHTVGQLTHSGEREIRRIGARTASRFKQLLDGKSDRIEYISTDMTRVLDSAKSFSRGISGEPVPDPVSVNNSLLRVYKSCPRYKAEVEDDPSLIRELDDLKSSDRYRELAEHVHDFLGLEDNVTLSYDDLRYIWELCAQDLTSYVEDGWCSLLKNQTSRSLLEEVEDLKYYRLYSYGNNVTRDIHCVILQKLFQLMDDAKTGYLNGSKDYLVGSFMFGHSGTLLGTLTALGLFDHPPPEWSVSRLGPMSGNVGTALYFCPHKHVTPATDSGDDPALRSGDFAVKVFFNERAVAIPTTAERVYWYEDFKKMYEQALTSCDVQELCKVGARGIDAGQDVSRGEAKAGDVLMIISLVVFVLAH